MTTETVVPAATESPAVTTETQAPVSTEAPQTTTEAPAAEPTPSKPYTSARELVAAARGRRIEPTHHSATQPRDDVGKWAQDAAKEAASTEPVASDVAGEQATQPDAAATEAAATEPTEQPAAPAPPTNTVRIELPEGHPLRSQGLEHIDAPTEQERAIRSLVNDPVRRAELDTARQEIRTLREQLIRAQAESRAYSETYDETLADPEIADRIARIRTEWGDEAAETFKRGIQQKVQQKADTHRQSLEQQAQEQQVELQGRAFAHAVEGMIVNQFPQWWTAQPGFGGKVNEILHAYGSELDAKEKFGRPANADPAEVIRRLEYQFMQDPNVRQRAQAALQQKQQAEAAAARARAAEEAAKAAAEKERLAVQTASQAAGRNPFGKVSTGINHSTQGATPATPQTAKDFVRQTMSRRA